MENFVKYVINNGGRIKPLIIPVELGTNGTGLFNPSIYNDDGKLLLNIRHCQYTIYHSEHRKFEHQWGPLCYLCPEDDMTLTTTNYFCEVDGEDLSIKNINKIDTSNHDIKPIWEFVGLEDCRVVKWDEKIFVSGVRRDVFPNGQGRMELSELEIGDGVKEVSRFRIPAPGDNLSYCEKNWVPIVDIPYHYVKWSNPTEIVRVDPETKSCEQVFLGDFREGYWYDFRGGSQVIPFGEYRITIAHLLAEFNKSEAGRKDAKYRHCFIVWDKNWNVVKYGEIFDFMGAKIEFCCGLTEYEGKYLITFGFQDNAAYILEVPKKIIEEMVYGRN